MRMQKDFPSEYNFFPQTYLLPHDFKEFTLNNNIMVGNTVKEAASDAKPKSLTYIVKPEGGCQGKGIFLVTKPEQLLKQIGGGSSGGTQSHLKGDDMLLNGQPLDHMVVQTYLTDPYLIEGFKFDFRFYVLVNGVAPMRIYMYNDGLARLATVPY